VITVEKSSAYRNLVGKPLGKWVIGGAKEDLKEVFGSN
jgi:hypothetical protein